MQAIATEYKGIPFRSRLEARIAATMDRMGVEWDYEVEAYALPGGYQYLPDFYLPQSNAWLEVKPPHVENDFKAGLFAEQIDAPVFLGTEKEGLFEVTLIKDRENVIGGTMLRCPMCKVTQPVSLWAESVRCCNKRFPDADIFWRCVKFAGSCALPRYDNRSDTMEFPVDYSSWWS